MNPNRFFMPNIYMNPMMSNNYMVPRNIGLLGRISNGIKSFNWGNFLNGANKTLNVVNQTIPLIRQTKPMISNMKHMINLARVFKKETSNNVKSNYNNNINVNNNVSYIEKKASDNNPNFFI